MNKRMEQKEKRKQQILSAGLDLFIHRGYAATKISDIAEKANMSVGLLFHYFESKEKLYEELVAYGTTGPKYIMELSQGEPLSFFQNAARQIFEFIKSDPFVAKIFVLMSQALYSEATPESVRRRVSQISSIDESVPLIEAGQKNKTIRDGDPRALALAYWTAIQGIAEEIAMRPGWPCPESEWVVDILRRKDEGGK
jgi:AcrR family transcriptional regulator